MGSRITTEEFFQRGASIGLQIKQGTNNPEGLWNNTAMFLTSIVSANLPTYLPYHIHHRS